MWMYFDIKDYTNKVVVSDRFGDGHSLPIPDSSQDVFNVSGGFLHTVDSSLGRWSFTRPKETKDKFDRSLTSNPKWWLFAWGGYGMSSFDPKLATFIKHHETWMPPGLDLFSDEPYVEPNSKMAYEENVHGTSTILLLKFFMYQVS